MRKQFLAGLFLASLIFGVGATNSNAASLTKMTATVGQSEEHDGAIKRAADKIGDKTEEGWDITKKDTKKAAHATAHTTKKVAHTTAHDTKKVSYKTAHGTKKAAVAVGDKTEEGWDQTKTGTKKVSHKVSHKVKKVF